MTVEAWSEQVGSLQNTFYLSRYGWKHSPYLGETDPLGYYIERVTIDPGSQLGSYGLQCGRMFWGERFTPHIVTTYPGLKDDQGIYFTDDGDKAYARAYSKFQDLCYTRASNLTALAERGQTFRMVASRLGQLLKGAKSLKKGRFREFLKTFGLTPKPKHKNTAWVRPKDFSALWLEYWMGWAPTLGDVYKNVEALSRRIPDHPIKAFSTVRLDGTYVQSNQWSKATSTWKGKGTVVIQGLVEITNPSLHIAQTLGLVNPLQTLWEVIPFSWFVDWFTNVGQVLGSLTDWVGLKLVKTSIAVKTRIDASWHCSGATGVYGPSEPDVMYHKKGYEWFSRFVVSNLPFVPPYARVPDGLSLTRGATALSLLIQLFTPASVKTNRFGTVF